ncbi:MAG: hypothetical protein LUG93_06930 [Lachnospiraceae bacterium]|nr:hypothetical protein [Lachnospiraceae bacterium]
MYFHFLIEYPSGKELIEGWGGLTMKIKLQQVIDAIEEADDNWTETL